MIKLKKEKKREYTILKDDKEILSLSLVFSPATNKFDRIIEYIEDCSEKLGKEFDDWFEQYLTEYKQSNFNYNVIKKHIPTLMSMVHKHLAKSNVNFDNYINKDKISKNSIFFDAEELKKLIITANYLKLYFIISQDTIMKLPTRFHKEIYKILTKDISECSILFKLFKIVSSKTYKYNLTDSYMWEYIKGIYCKTTDMHIITIFNFLVNNILVSCNTNQNPIPYMISVIDSSIGWLLRTVYKNMVVYTDTVSTEDVYSVQGKDNLKTYSYNDTIGRLVLLAYNCLDQEEIPDIQFNESIKSANQTSLFSRYVTYPILSKVLDISYRHLLTIPIEHGYLLNILVYHHLPLEFKKKYPVLSQMLLHYNKEKPITKTTYRIKNITHFQKTIGSFLGFRNLTFVYDFYSNIVGKLARNTYVNFKSGREITNFPLARLEQDMIEFYNNYFNNDLDKTISNLKTTFYKML